MTDVSTLTLREALDLVEPREAYFDVLVSGDWVALSAAVQSAELMLAAAEKVPAAKRDNARKVAQGALEAAQAAYAPHVKRVWFDPAPDYEELSLSHDRKDLIPILLEKCARDSDLTADEWAAFIAKWPAADRGKLSSTVLYLNIEPTVPDLGKGFSPTR